MKQYLIKHGANETRRETPDKTPLLVMPFGKFKGYRFENIPESYLFGLADDFNRDRIGVLPDDRFKFKVPLEVREKAREELKRRGYRKKGSHWEYDR